MATLKQKLAIEKMSENVGKPLGQIMREVGYSDSMADNPDHLTKSKGWQELIEQYYPDERVESVLAEALNATKVISVISGKQANGGTVDFIKEPDWDVRIRAIKEIHKIKARVCSC